MEKFGLDEKAIASIKSVLSQYPEIEKTIIYGSRAKGSFRQGSDIDLVLVAPQLTTEELLKIENQLDDLLLPYKIDLSLEHQIENPNLLDHIKRVGRLF